MTASAGDIRFSRIKQSLIELCQESGIVTATRIEDVFHEDLIESGIMDSMGLVCLQEQIESHFKVTISQDQFVAELHTLNRLVEFLATHSAVEVPA